MENQKKGLNISAKSFITAILILLLLMIGTYILSFFVPGGCFERVSENGRELVVPGTYRAAEGGIPFWKFILSPFLVLGSEGGGTIIAVTAFLIVVGGVFNSLEKCGLMKYMLDKIVARYRSARYRLLLIVALFFMAMGSFIGSFEECVPLVPIVVALSVSLGWDSVTGLGMSLLAAGCGFAAGICNPFTIGVAQELAGLKMFSGLWLRLLSFALIYALLSAFLYIHAKKVDRGSTDSGSPEKFVPNKKMDRALVCFVTILGAGIIVVLSSGFIPALRDFTMPVVALTFLAAGISSVLVSGMSGRELGRTFFNGALSIAPAILMILMASSIRYILTEARILDTILYHAMNMTSHIPSALIILFIYLIALVMNFFISSGSAKAFLLMPLITPVADLWGISRQLCVVAYAFGDGFSNVFYVTNPVLLISLGLAGVSYGKWVKWSWKFQACNLVLTALLLLLGFAVGYA
ncbi:MAG: hypothetical protein ACOX68_05950 [Candidatus Limivicinus sp.]|jgi:uncharacterized ion transporter superfamily protein YfcC